MWMFLYVYICIYVLSIDWLSDMQEADVQITTCLVASD